MPTHSDTQVLHLKSTWSQTPFANTTLLESEQALFDTRALNVGCIQSILLRCFPGGVLRDRVNPHLLLGVLQCVRVKVAARWGGQSGWMLRVAEAFPFRIPCDMSDRSN